jgi:hypothetical protein
MNKMGIKYPLISTIAAAVFLAGACTATAQYYYKDIITTAQISANFRLLKTGKVNRVMVTPSGNNGQAGDAVKIEQAIFPQQNKMVTYTKTPGSGESWLTSYYNKAGYLIQTTDSSTQVITRTDYHYNEQNQLADISSSSATKDNYTSTESHVWTYRPDGSPGKMLKTRNGADTTFVSFVPDEKGNTGEEKAVRNKNSAGSTYYYYDLQNRLTDVALYNQRAGRILPEYMFEYDESGRVSQMIIVPEGSSDYQVWKYAYNIQGLKQQELCYDKHKQLLGKVEYKYEGKF